MLSSTRPLAAARRTLVNRALCRRSIHDDPQPRSASKSAMRMFMRNMWDTEKLATNPAYPLSAQLKQTAVPMLKPAKVTTNVGAKHYLRPQIVSPGLCDDVLAYIGPSLEQYRGCDILDINPGAGLWSSKLHDFLQPRSHILLESSPQEFAPYLEPLVNSPGSTYKLVTGDVTSWETYDRIIDEGHFPHQTRKAHEDPDAQKLNNTLLVTGTLMWDPKLTGLGIDSMARQMVATFTKMARSNEVFHALGPARMLFWGLGDDMHGFTPKSIPQVKKTSLLFSVCSDMAEVVTPRLSDIGNHGRRPAQFIFESAIRALERGREKGMELPAHRQDYLHKMLPDILAMSNGTGRATAAQCMKYLKTQYAKGVNIKGLVAGQIADFWGQVQPPRPEIPSDGKAKGKGAPKTASNELKAWTIRKASANKTMKDEVKCEGVAELLDLNYQQECKILGMEDGPEKDAELSKLEAMEKESTIRLGILNNNLVTRPAMEFDERMSIRSPATQLPWDTRSYEALVMQPDEVWPISPVTLLDITPRPRPEGMTHVDWEYLQDFVDGLGQNIGDSVVAALDNLQHGLSAIVDDVEMLRDPEKGGRLHLQHLRTRVLTAEMMEHLGKAFREWPFRYPDSDYPKYFRSRNNIMQNKRWAS